MAARTHRLPADDYVIRTRNGPTGASGPDAPARRKPGPKPGTEAAKRGGTAAREKYGRAFYSRIGVKGGSTVWDRHGHAFYEDIGRRGGEATKHLLGTEHYRRIGRIGGQRAHHTRGGDGTVGEQTTRRLTTPRDKTAQKYERGQLGGQWVGRDHVLSCHLVVQPACLSGCQDTSSEPLQVAPSRHCAAQADEAVVDEVRWGSTSLMVDSTTTGKGKQSTAGAPTERRVGGARRHVHLQPVGPLQESGFDPYTPPDPWELQQVYGNHQLAAALHRYSIPSLMRALLPVLERYPHTKPAKKKKADIVDYIVARLTGDDS